MRYLYSTIILLTLGFSGMAQTWTTITNDGSGDGFDSKLLDGTNLEYYYDGTGDSIWFRITCASISTSQSTMLGFNIMVNYVGGGSTFMFWGTDNSNNFHRLVTGWVTGTAPSTYTGTIGVADSAGVAMSNYTNLASNNLVITVDTTAGTIVVGMPRADLLPASAFGTAVLTAAAVGSNVSWNDDIYSSAGTMTLTMPSSIQEVNATTLNIYPNPVSSRLNVSQEWMGNNFKVYDVLGKQYMNGEITESTIDLSSLPSGVYILQVKDGDNLLNGKFIKE